MLPVEQVFIKRIAPIYSCCTRKRKELPEKEKYYGLATPNIAEVWRLVWQFIGVVHPHINSSLMESSPLDGAMTQPSRAL